MKTLILFVFFFYSACGDAAPLECVGKKNAIILNELRFDFYLLRNKNNSQNNYVGVQLVRKNISKQNVVLYVRKGNNHRLLFRLEQNDKIVFESRLFFGLHSSHVYEGPEFSTINLEPGEIFVDEVFFSEIKGEIKSSFNYDAPLKLSGDFELTYARDGEKTSPLESEKNRRDEMRSRDMARPNPFIYRNILISR